MMLDKNGVELKTGQIVKIEGGYFKADNGTFVIKCTPGDPQWLGNYYSLKKCNKKGKESETKYSTASWPIMVTVNSQEKTMLAKEHNKKHATIEVMGEVKIYEILVKQTICYGNTSEHRELATKKRYQELLTWRNTEIEIISQTDIFVEEVEEPEVIEEMPVVAEKVKEVEKELIVHELSKDLIHRSNYNSFAGKRGDISQSSYLVYVEKIKKWDITFENKQKLLNTLFKKWSELLKYESQHVSVMVAGPAKYNSKKLDKGDRILKLSSELSKWFNHIEYQIKHNTAHDNIIKSSDSDAVQKLKDKLEKALKEHQEYKDYNAKARKEGTAPHAPYVLQNSNGRIKAIRDRLARLEREKSQEVKEESFGDIKIVDNTELSRVQIIFPGIPDKEIRTELKRFGFKWAPSQGAWQNYRNRTNLDNAKNIIQKAI